MTPFGIEATGTHLGLKPFGIVPAWLPNPLASAVPRDETGGFLYTQIRVFRLFPKRKLLGFSKRKWDFKHGLVPLERTSRAGLGLALAGARFGVYRLPGLRHLAQALEIQENW